MTQIDILPADASYFTGGVLTALGVDDLLNGVADKIEMDAVVILSDLSRATSVLVTDSGAGHIAASNGTIDISASNEGGINANIVSDAIGVVTNTVNDSVSVSIFDSTLTGESVSLTASSEAVYSAQGKVLSNSVKGDVVVDVDPSIIIATSGNITISATDSIEVLALTSEATLDLEAIEDFITGGGGTFDSIDVDVIFAFNTIDRDVRAAVFDGSSLTTTDGDIDISATREAKIEADAKASALSNGSSTTAASIAFSGGGTFSQNTILGNTEAYIENSSATTNNAGEIKVTAKDVSTIDARAYADSAVNLDEGDAKTNGSQGTDALSVGVSIAQNTIGWETQFLLGSALDTLLGDSLLGDAKPAQISAYIVDSEIVAAGAVSVSAMSMAKINSTVSNSVSSVNSTLYQGSSMGVSALLSGNKVNTDVKAFVSEEVVFNFDSTQGSRDLKTGDRVEHGGAVYEYLAAPSNIGLDDGTQNYAASPLVWQLIALDGAATSITAGGDVTVSASDESLIDANSKVVSTSITTNDGGASLSNDAIGFFADVSFTTNGAVVGDTPTEIEPVSTVASTVDLVFKDRIRLTVEYVESGAGKGESGSVYEYLGSGSLGSEDMIDLTEEDFTNLDLWKKIKETQIIPEGNNLSDSDSVSVGGMAVLNDVRGEVQAYINDAVVNVTGWQHRSVSD